MSSFPIDDKAIKLANHDFSKRIKPTQTGLPKARKLSDVVIERMAEKELEKSAPSTGYPDLDQLIRGFIPGHLYSLTGDTNVGKTTLACNFAIRIAKQKKSVLYFALEPENMVVDYLASIKQDKPFHELQPEDYDFEDAHIDVYGKEEISTIQDLVQIVKAGERYDLIIVDHIGYFVGSGNNNLFQDQSNAVKQLAGLAKEKKTAIMLIAHLRKKQQNTKKNYIPTSDDISGSGSFKQDSTEVIIVTRTAIESEGGIEYTNDGILYVTKTKCGPNGNIPIIFSDRKANITSFGEMRKINEERVSRLGWVSANAKIDDKW